MEDLFPDHKANQRFLCPRCQRNWAGARGAPCEPCYTRAWDARMDFLGRYEEARRDALDAREGAPRNNEED